MSNGAKDSDNHKSDVDDMSDKEELIESDGEASSKEDLEENSATESFGDSDDEKSASGSSKEANDQDEDESYSEDQSADDKELQEQKDENEEFQKNQEMLLKNVREHEKELADLPKLRPCQSCEFPDPWKTKKATCCWGKLSNPCKKRQIEEFWIVSVPGDNNPQGAFDRLNEATVPKNLSINYKLHIPSFKIGRMDDLLYVTGSLSKLEGDAERILKSLVDFMRTVVEEDVRIFLETSGLDAINYIVKFTWNSAKYPEQRPLSVLKDIIRSQFRNMEDNLKVRSDEFNSLDKKLQNIEKQKTDGNLLTRSLADIVKKEDFVLGSRMLTTLLVVVPLNTEKSWNKGYHSLAEWVVPNSANRLYQDKSHALYSVVIIKKSVDEFKKKARGMKVQVRDFDYSEEAMAAEKNIQRYVEDLRRAEIDVLHRWLKVSFSESLAGWIHVKAMRVFAESVLRFGLKSGFQAMILLPLEKKKLNKTLAKLYDDIDNDLGVGLIEDVPGGLSSLGGDVENTKYVFLSVPVNFILKQ